MKMSVIAWKLKHVSTSEDDDTWNIMQNDMKGKESSSDEGLMPKKSSRVLSEITPNLEYEVRPDEGSRRSPLLGRQNIHPQTFPVIITFADSHYVYIKYPKYKWMLYWVHRTTMKPFHEFCHNIKILRYHYVVFPFNLCSNKKLTYKILDNGAETYIKKCFNINM